MTAITANAQSDGNSQENPDPVAEAFLAALENGADPDEAFEEASYVAVQSMQESGNFSRNAIEQLVTVATDVWQNERPEEQSLGKHLRLWVRSCKRR